MQKYLVDVPQKGDTVVFYDASHGSLRVNSKGNKLTVLVGNGNMSMLTAHWFPLTPTRAATTSVIAR